MKCEEARKKLNEYLDNLSPEEMIEKYDKWLRGTGKEQEQVEDIMDFVEPSEYLQSISDDLLLKTAEEIGYNKGYKNAQADAQVDAQVEIEELKDELKKVIETNGIKELLKLKQQIEDMEYKEKYHGC